MAKNPETFFRRLTRLFRSGPAIQRRIKGVDQRSYYGSQLIQGNYGYRAPSPLGFGRENSPFSSIGNYGILDRMARYAEFAEMEYTGEIASALDIYADETVGGDDRGKAFHVYSDKHEIKNALDELFFDIVNVEFNLRAWARNLVKYGDFFLYNEVMPETGVISVAPIPVSELEREEGYDEYDPYAVRFKWLTRGNQHLENWQVTHMRILGNDLFLPYGTSILESGRRIWRQLIMMEDAMLVYRVVRSPERRVFYIDVGNMAPNDIPSYMEKAKATMRSNSIVNKEDGRVDYRYGPISVDEDYFIPVRGQQQATRVESLAGGTNATATEDVEYIQKKLFSALKIPKAYLTYDENIGAKATLAQEDVRFSRTIAAIQKVIISELNKLAMIHLFSKGFDGEDLINFELKLSNPSTIALQQRLELWSTKFDIADSAKNTELVDSLWIQRNLLELTEDEILDINKGMIADKIREAELDEVKVEAIGEQEDKTVDEFDPSGYDMPNVEKEPPRPEDEGESSESILSRIADDNPEKSFYIDDNQAPIRANPVATKNRKNRKRRVGASKGRSNQSNPDYASMLNPRKSKSLKDLYDKSFLDNPLGEGYEDFRVNAPPMLSKEFESIMKNFESKYKDHSNNKIEGLLKEVKTDSDSDTEMIVESIVDDEISTDFKNNFKESFDEDD